MGVKGRGVMTRGWGGGEGVSKGGGWVFVEVEWRVCNRGRIMGMEVGVRVCKTGIGGRGGCVK